MATASMEKPSKVTLRLEQSTKKRIQELAAERKKAENDSERTLRKQQLSETLGKWTMPIEDTLEATLLSNKKKISKTGQKRKIVKRTPSGGAIIRTGGDDNNRQLGKMLDEMNRKKPAKKDKARTVVSDGPHPTVRDDDNDRSAVTEIRKRPASKNPRSVPTRSMSTPASALEEGDYAAMTEGRKRPERKNSGSAPRRTVSAPTATRSSSKGRDRSQSPHALQKRTQSPQSLKNRRPSRRKEDDSDQHLSRSEDSEQISSSHRRQRSSSQGPLDTRSRRSRRKAQDIDVSLILDGPKTDAPPRVKSVEDAGPLEVDKDGVENDGVGDRQKLETETKSKKAEKSARKKKKKKAEKAKDKIKKADDIDKTASTHQRDSSSGDEDKQREGSKRRDRKSMMESFKDAMVESSRRSRSADPKSTIRKSREERVAEREKKKEKGNEKESTKSSFREGIMESFRRSRSADPKNTNRKSREERVAEREKEKEKNQSIMLHRDVQRRLGKSKSLMNLQHYSEEEIHSTSYFASIHVLVNRERMKRGIRPLTRNVAMDELARQNAQRMAESVGVSHLETTYIGNVLRGESIRAVHRATMQNKDGRERENLLNPYFQEFGVGTAKGDDEMLYICQLFSERLELVCTNTEFQTDAESSSRRHES